MLSVLDLHLYKEELHQLKNRFLCAETRSHEDPSHGVPAGIGVSVVFVGPLEAARGATVGLGPVIP